LEYYEDYLEEDELDLLELISSDSNTTNQYLAFVGSNNETYAINVSKVIEILVYKELPMVHNGKSESLIKGTAKIRDMMATIINFDEWFGNEELCDNEYEFIILAGFGGYNLGIMIKSVEYIVNIESEKMQDNSDNNPKTNFITEIKIGNETRLCTVFDCDRLLLDTFDEVSKKTQLSNLHIENTCHSSKQLFFADDSLFIRKTLQDLFEKLEVKYTIFENGSDLLEALQNTNPNEIGLIITDLEMPIMDGEHLIKNIKNNYLYKDIPIIVHTNISNFISEEHLHNIGADKVFGKIDPKQLSEAILYYING
jgi:two-component system, chemotaxis family, chemotaxis protein CheV